MVVLTSRKKIINVDVFHSILNIYIFLFCWKGKDGGNLCAFESKHLF